MFTCKKRKTPQKSQCEGSLKGLPCNPFTFKTSLIHGNIRFLCFEHVFGWNFTLYWMFLCLGFNGGLWMDNMATAVLPPCCFCRSRAHCFYDGQRRSHAITLQVPVLLCLLECRCARTFLSLTSREGAKHHCNVYSLSGNPPPLPREQGNG